MGHIPLVSIKLEGNECFPIDDMLYYAKLPNKERLHSKRITIEYYPEKKCANILAVEYKEEK
jgi:hypothetical protein